MYLATVKRSLDWWEDRLKRMVQVTFWEDSPHAVEFLAKGRWMCRRLYPHELPEELRYKLAMLVVAPDSFDSEDEDNDIGWRDELNDAEYRVYVSKETLNELTGDGGNSGNT